MKIIIEINDVKEAEIFLHWINVSGDIYLGAFEPECIYIVSAKEVSNETS
jgi:hypothetical protein